MIKRLLFVLALSFTAQWVAAQTISDDQVVKTIMAEREKGSNEESIARLLLQKGATPAQLRRIKDKYEKEKSSMGAVDLTGKEKKDNRLRGNAKEGADEKENTKEKNNFQLSAETKEPDTHETLQKEMGFLDIDSVMYYKSMLKEEIGVFGRNLFNNELLTFEPAMNIPVPSDYVLGAGDQVIIDVWGASQMTFDSLISPEGFVVIEGAGRIKLAGLTVAEAEEFIKTKLEEYYSGSETSLSVGTTRNVKVEIVGEVVTPGSYTLSAFSTLFNALYMAGGISELGTLREIKVFRGGKMVSKVDIYDYIVNGNNTGNIRLQDNDLVIVGPYDAIVNIQGKVKRPMKYEMKSSETLSQLLTYTGGLTGDAYDKNLRVIRKKGREYSIHTVSRANFSSFTLADGDSVYVDSIIPRFSNMVEIKGAVFHPGMYEVNSEIKTVLDLIDAADGLREDAFLARAVMHRRKADRRLEVLAVDVEGIMDGRIPDIELRKEDVLFIPSTTEMRGQETLKISGEVNYPGLYEYAENTTLEDFVLQAGGLTNVASEVKIDVYRMVYDPKSLQENDTITKVFCFGLKDGFVVDGTPGFVLAPYDEVHVRKSPAHNAIKSVSVEGLVNFSGSYAMSGRDYRLSDLVKDAGGLSSTAYPEGARLYRKMTPEEFEQQEHIAKRAQMQIYSDALRSEKGYDMSVIDSLLTMKQGTVDSYLIDIDLVKAIASPGSNVDVVLREGDRLVVPEASSTVKISGEVHYPIAVTYKKGAKLSYYIKHAGGYSDRAKKNGIYAIYMNGGVKKISRNSSSDIAPGMEIVVPTKNLGKRLSTAEIVTISSSTVSIATMIVTIANLLKK